MNERSKNENNTEINDAIIEPHKIYKVQLSNH